MKKLNAEISVGIFVLAGLLCLAYLSIKLGKVELWGGNYYELTANFESVSGLKTGATVEIAGVDIGRVCRIKLDIKRGYTAKVFLQIKPGINLSDDTIASIRTSGIIGDKYVRLQPGRDNKMLAGGSRIRHTESAIDLEQIISEYIQGKV
jgi:phospholipid/cholesterol/gamma-HCH transport system substrate-binding protein